jgi:hypothetical protein
MRLLAWKPNFLFKQNLISYCSVFLCLFISACGSQQTVETAELTRTPTPVFTVQIAAPPPVMLPSATNIPQPILTATPDDEAGDLADYYGGLVVTLDYVGQTITMNTGQGFVLRLGNEFDWKVEITPEDLLTINRKITPEQGEQGVYVARKKGVAYLSAIGSPKCLQNDPPCSRPTVLFKLVLDIQ